MVPVTILKFEATDARLNIDKTPSVIVVEAECELGSGFQHVDLWRVDAWIVYRVLQSEAGDSDENSKLT